MRKLMVLLYRTRIIMPVVIETFLDSLKRDRPGTYNRLMELVDDKRVTLKAIAHELHFMLKMEEGALLSLLKKLSADNHWREKEIVKVEKKKEGGGNGKGMFDLTEADVQFLQDFRDGKVGFEKAQRELAARAFAKILADPGSVNVRDWLQSELVLMKKDEMVQKKESMEKAMARMFSGMVVEVCPHCGKAIYDVQEGEVVEEGTETNEMEV